MSNESDLCRQLPWASVIIQKGSSLRADFVSDKVFGVMVWVSLLTCITTPLCLRSLIYRWRMGRGLLV